MNEFANRSAALSHHWLVAWRGGEKVLAALREILPQAEIHTLVHDTGRAGDRWGDGVHSSWLRFVPRISAIYPKLLPLMPMAARSMRLPDVDLVVCSDAALAKAMRVGRRSKLVCYCHSPMRYVWEQQLSETYRATIPVVLRPFWPMVSNYVRRCDLAASKRVDLFVANSAAVAERIRRCYGREAEVVYPPVDLPERPNLMARDDFYLAVGQHVIYKRLDLAVAACVRLGRRLVVIGEGPQAVTLKQQHAGNRLIEFLGYQSDEVVLDHYKRARGLLFAGEEDFGIVPVEAMAAGCPVIALGVGGARETVIDGVTGVWFASGDVDALADAIERAERTTFDATVMFERMQRFSKDRFKAEMTALLARVLEGRSRGQE